MFTDSSVSGTEPSRRLPRVYAARWIFVGEDVVAFVNKWLKPFAEMHARSRIEGYVLDLTNGRLWAALDISDVSQDVYDDIVLQVVKCEDAMAFAAFMRLTRTCNPITADNKITCAFDTQKWPKLAAACSLLAGLAPQETWPLSQEFGGPEKILALGRGRHLLPSAQYYQPRPDLEQKIEDLWRTGRPRVVGLIGLGGTGKTALVQHFVEKCPLTREMRSPKETDRELPPADALFVWDFYANPFSSEAFLTSFADYLGLGDVRNTDAEDIVALIRQRLTARHLRRTLLVLDGLENIQRSWKGSVTKGELLSFPLLKLFEEIAAGKLPILAIFTSQLEPVELQEHFGEGYVSIHVGVGELSVMAIRSEEEDMTSNVQPADVQRWIDLLRSSVSTERLKGASELASLAIRTRTRGAVRTRGGISRAAPSRLPPGVNLSATLNAFRDQHTEVRRAVAFTLGEWADEAAVEVLSRIAEADPDSSVRGEAIDALGKIGGLRAVEFLKTSAHKDLGAEVRIRALRALADLAQAEPSANQEVIDTLTGIEAQDSSDRVKDQAKALLARLGQV